MTSETAREGRWHRAELAKAGDAAASSRWHHHTFGLSLILCARGSVTLPTLLPFPQSLSACLVCLQPAGICVCVLSPAGATEFLYGFTLSVFGPNSAAPRFKGGRFDASRPPACKTRISFGDCTSGDHFWMAALNLGQRQEAGAQHKGLQGFTGQGKAAHKQCT